MGSGPCTSTAGRPTTPRPGPRPCSSSSDRPPLALRLRGLRGHHLEEHLVLLDQAELVARALLDRLEPLLQVAHLGVERAVALRQPGVGLLLFLHLALEAPHPQPAALAEPQRILQREDEAGERAGQYFHRSW